MHPEKLAELRAVAKSEERPVADLVRDAIAGYMVMTQPEAHPDAEVPRNFTVSLKSKESVT